MVKRSASLSISDLEEVANVPHSPTRSKGTFIGIGSRRKTLGGSLSAGTDFQTLHTKQPYMLVQEMTRMYMVYCISQVDHWIGQCIVSLCLLGLD